MLLRLEGFVLRNRFKSMKEIGEGIIFNNAKIENMRTGDWKERVEDFVERDPFGAFIRKKFQSTNRNLFFLFPRRHKALYPAIEDTQFPLEVGRL